MTKQQIYATAGSIVALIVLGLIAELLYIKYAGSMVAVPSIPRQYPAIGSGTELRFVVMGDSTAVSQGSVYDKGYAVAATRHLARMHRVTMLNTAVSGATAETVLRDQLTDATAFAPDLVVLAVGANDATHFTSGKTLASEVQKIIDGLRKANKNVRIVVTGSPAMDSVSRFPFASKWLMNLRTKQVNAAFDTLIRRNGLISAPIAVETRRAFLDDPSLTAADKFHPNARGYALWIPVINRAIDDALAL